MFIANDFREEGEIETIVEEENAELAVVELEENEEVSLRSLLGFSKKGMMKLMGMLYDKEVMVLIDCGANP